MTELKETRQALADAESKLSSGKLADILKDAVTLGDVKIATKKLSGVLPDALRQMTDTAKAENDNLVTVLAAVNGEKITFCVSCGKTALSLGAHAGNLVREVAKITGGNGGGKPDSAMAGGKDANKIDEALNQAVEILKSQLK
jgi:alanyl-tRNA synthetase